MSKKDSQSHPNRRDTLMGVAGLTVAASGVSVASIAADKKLGWAIVGLGSFAENQMMPAFADSKLAKITGLVSGTPQKLVNFGKKYDVAPKHHYSYQDFDKILKDDAIDVVYIVLPVGMHAEYAIRAFKAGKHVFCEKPMASTVAECEAMIAAAKAANKQLGIAYRVHFDPQNIEAARIIKSGEIGDIRYFSADAGFSASLDYVPHRWRLTKALGGGGSMYDIGIYALNAALMSLDDTPVSVSAVYSTPPNDPRFKEVEGGMEWRLNFSSGICAQGSSSYCYHYVTRQRAHGTTGAVEVSPASSYSGVKVYLQKGWGEPTPVNAGKTETMFAAQIDGFSKAAMTNTPHLTPGEMGLRDIKIIQAMYQSADMGGQIVKL